MNNVSNTNNNYSPNIHLLNSNIDKRFYNYFLNGDTSSIRTNSTNSNYSQKTKIDINEYNRKFNSDVYLKYMI